MHIYIRIYSNINASDVFTSPLCSLIVEVTVTVFLWKENKAAVIPPSHFYVSPNLLYSLMIVRIPRSEFTFMGAS